jgi:hypothetical protein
MESVRRKVDVSLKRVLTSEKNWSLRINKKGFERFDVIVVKN